MIEFISFNNLEQAQRLFHGRGHAYAGYEHVNVDWLAPVILITLYQEVEHDWLMATAHQLKENINAATSVQVQYRCRKLSPTEVLLGDNVLNTTAQESGLSFAVEFGKAQNTGLFLDMKNGRDWVHNQAKDKNILNLFAYTCSFSIAAIAGGAKQVVNIDISKASLNKGRENHHLNKQSTANVVFQGVDIFKSYNRLKKYGPYDMLICDPPSFQKGSVDIKRDYSKIIRRIPQLMHANSQLLLCLNSPDLDEQFLLDEVARECPQCQFVEKLANPAVFKEAHQGKGLKVMLFVFKPEL